MLYRFGSAEISLHLLRADPSWSAAHWYHHKIWPDGTVDASFGRLAGSFLLRFHDGPEFLISQDGRHIQCAPGPGVHESFLNELFLNQVLPYALGLHGFLTLHGAAAATPAGVIAFMGKSGDGKSTLVRALVESGRDVRTLSDDCLIVRREEGGLMAFSLDGEAVLLDRMYLLEPAPAGRVASQPMSHGEALRSVLEHSCLLHTEDPQGTAVGFQSITNLLLTRIRRLQVPRHLELLPSLVKGLLDGSY